MWKRERIWKTAALDREQKNKDERSLNELQHGYFAGKHSRVEQRPQTSKGEKINVCGRNGF